MEDKRNICNVRTMKEVLVGKFQDENCCFGIKDVMIKQDTKNNGYKIVIKEYEHIPFFLSFEEDDYFGYIVTIQEECDNTNVVWIDSKNCYDVKRALIHLGYYIATRF